MYKRQPLIAIGIVPEPPTAVGCVGVVPTRVLLFTWPKRPVRWVSSIKNEQPTLARHGSSCASFAGIDRIFIECRTRNMELCWSRFDSHRCVLLPLRLLMVVINSDCSKMYRELGRGFEVRGFNRDFYFWPKFLLFDFFLLPTSCCCVYIAERASAYESPRPQTASREDLNSATFWLLKASSRPVEVAAVAVVAVLRSEPPIRCLLACVRRGRRGGGRGRPTRSVTHGRLFWLLIDNCLLYTSPSPRD